jgi:nucleotide-binding universal stress UspA family protein
MIRLKKILLATDFGDSSAFALEYARELATKFGAELHIIHVVADIGQAALGAPGLAMDMVELQRNLEREGAGRVEALLTTFDRDVLRAKTVCRTAGHPAEAIVDYAKEAGADVIVVGTHGRQGLSHMLVGSVAERVVRSAPCPVVVAKWRAGR